MYRKINQIIGLFMVTLMIGMTGIYAFGLDDEGLKGQSVLVLHSYSEDFIWTRDLQESIRESFESIQDPFTMRIEYMDSKNAYTDAIKERLFDLYRTKYAPGDFDIVIATDNIAYNFLLEYKETLFGDIPVVATGINNTHLIEMKDRFYVIEEKPDYEATIDLAIRQNPEADDFYIILDETTTSQLVKAELDQVLKGYKNDFKITYIRDLSESTALDMIEGLDQTDILLFGLYFTDPDGTAYTYYDKPRQVAQMANTPVYVFWDFQLGWGTLGGKVAHASVYGERAVDNAEKLLSGREIAEIYYDEGLFGEYIYDYEVSQRYNLSDFPKEAIAMNKPQTYFEKNRDLIMAFITTTAVLLLVMLLLILVIKQKMDNLSKDENIIELNKEVIETQKDLITTLGDVIETKSEGTANHVKRVSLITRLLGEKYGLSDRDLDILEMTSPMHDVGKIGISEDILSKKGKLTKEEFETMKFHTMIGHEILKNQNKEILNYASIISKQHHEHWDGTGYPDGIKGDDIHIMARITAVADVYDALRSKRTYKESWQVKDVIDFFKEEKGKIFDPKLVDILLNHVDDIESMREKYSDTHSRSMDLLNQKV
ncbi:HD domain-containing phosphohydrolase [Fusibacter sp. JL216-2]|uniref:HD domain-containing phosphohydrolase n=1 Tax=Fusibacter sp. JL216-2 TaxID=3071453 RepID=UPI003D3448D6